jgi:GDPmannose 4,6-dehydratase
MAKKALITGISGMDASHLADFLLTKDYEIYGIDRWKSVYNYPNIEHIKDKIKIFCADLTDQHSITRVVKEVQPDEVYNFAAQSFVGESWQIPEMTSNVTGLGVLRVLEAIKETNKNIRFFQASSSEMFAKSNGSIDENGIICPISPYGISKTYGHLITNSYRENHKIYAVSGILFNHESERRSLQFVTRKITNGVANIYKGKINKIYLGNLDSERDWGYAPDFVEGMWASLQQENSENFIFAAGKPKSIASLCQVAFNSVGIEDWQNYVGIDKNFYRPYDKRSIWGNYSKAEAKLNWYPKTSFEKWVSHMVQCDLNKN